MVVYICIIHIPQWSSMCWKAIHLNVPDIRRGRRRDCEDVLLLRFTPGGYSRGICMQLCTWKPLSDFPCQALCTFRRLRKEGILSPDLFRGFRDFRSLNVFIFKVRMMMSESCWCWCKAALRPKLKGWWRSSNALRGFHIWTPLPVLRRTITRILMTMMMAEFHGCD